MDEFVNTPSEPVQVDPLSIANVSDRSLHVSMLSFRNSFLSSYGTMENLPSHRSGTYDQPPLPLHHNISKTSGERHASHECILVAQSLPRSSTLVHQGCSGLGSHNNVTTANKFKTSSQSDIATHVFESVLYKQPQLCANASKVFQIAACTHQHQDQPRHDVMADANHYDQRLMNPCRQTSFHEHKASAMVRKQLDSQSQNDGGELKTAQSLVDNLSDSETAESVLRHFVTNSVQADSEPASGTSCNDIPSKWTNIKTCYKCGFCDLKVFNNEALLSHINTHTDLMPYSCSLCGVPFVEVGHLIKHVNHSHSVKAPYACGLCNLTFHQNVDLKEHVEETHGAEVKGSSISDIKISSFEGKEAERNVSTNLELDARIEVIESDNDKETGDNTCTGKNFRPAENVCVSPNTIVISKDTKFNLRKEPSKIVMDDIDLESVCTVLVEPSTAGGMRKRHLFKCNFCKKVCKDKGSLVSHARTHTKDRPYECSVCFAKFKQYAHLSDHITTKHSKDRPYICDRCAKAFNRKSHLQDHIRLKHTVDKLYHCTECPLTFQKRTEFSNHKRTHGKPAKYQCNMCLRQFHNITDYHRHIRSHTKEKCFECEICHLKFGLLANAKKHMIKHNKERPFKCDECPKAYHFEHDFKRHKLTHLRKKPFPCADCYKSFKNSALLKKHVKTAHVKSEISSEESFQCPICKKYLKSKLNLEKHSKTHMRQT